MSFFTSSQMCKCPCSGFDIFQPFQPLPGGMASREKEKCSLFFFYLLLFWPFWGENQSHLLSEWSWHGHLSPRNLISTTPWGALQHLSSDRVCMGEKIKPVCKLPRFWSSKSIKTEGVDDKTRWKQRYSWAAFCWKPHLSGGRWPSESPAGD